MYLNLWKLILLLSRGELKEKKIIADGLQDNLIAYVGNLKKSKDINDKLAGMY